MKNKFLLLGATAILSTGALMANALPVLDPLTPGNYAQNLTIHASVNIAHSFEVSESSPLYFGTLIDPVDGNTVILSVSSDIPTGTATVSKTGSSAPHRGSILVHRSDASPRFSFPNEIELKNGDTICGEATSFNVAKSEQQNPGSWDLYNYGATFTYDEALETGLCSGTGEVTVLLDIEE